MRRVALLSHFFPFPSQVGAQIRTSLILKALSSVTDVVLIGQECGETDLSEAKKYCKNFFVVKSLSRSVLSNIARRLKEPFVAFPASGGHLNIKQFKKILYSLPKDYDDAVIWLEALWLMKAVNKNDERKIVLDQHNIDSEVLKRRYQNGAFPINLLYYNDFLKQKWYEKENIKRASKIFSVSPDEKEKHIELFGDLDIDVLPNGVEIEKYPLLFPNYKEKTITMTGDFGYIPNVEGLNYFLREIFKGVKKEIKDAKVLVAGKNSKSLKINNEDVVLYGEFKDPAEIFKRTTFSIAPILTGGGSRYKIIESLALGIPVVSTPEGAEGLNIKESEGLFVAKDPKEFADKMIKLFLNEEMAQKAGAKGRKAIEENYSFDAVEKSLINSISDILN